MRIDTMFEQETLIRFIDSLAEAVRHETECGVPIIASKEIYGAYMNISNAFDQWIMEYQNAQNKRDEVKNVVDLTKVLNDNWRK